MYEQIDQVLERNIPFWHSLKRHASFRRLLGFQETLWGRLVSDRETRKVISALRPAELSVLEVSGCNWQTFGFRSYRNTSYPAFDICAERLDERFNLIIVEHVLERSEE